MLKHPVEELCQRLKISESAIQTVDVLVLPENIDTAKSPGEFIEPEDGVYLAKHLKQHGLTCKTAFDLGPPPKVKERRGADVWLGVVWVLNSVALPLVVNLISNWLWDRYARGGTPAEPKQLTIEKETLVHIELRIQRDDGMTTIDFSGTITELRNVLAAWTIVKEKPE